MSRIYTFDPPAQNPGGAKSLASVTGGNKHSFRLRRVVISNADVAGATNIDITISRITAIGTGTALAPNPHMQDDTAFTGTCNHTLTVEPTKTLSLADKRWNLITDCIFDFEDHPLEFNATEAGVVDGFCVTPSADPGANTRITCVIEEV